MYVIGIHDGHNASVTLSRDGEIVYVLSEERITRVKNQGGMPVNAIVRMLHDMKLEFKDIESFVISGITPPSPVWYERDLILKRYREQADMDLKAYSFKNWIRGFLPKNSSTTNISQETRLAFLLEKNINPEKIKFYDHHLCHAAAAYHSQGDYNQKYLVLTNDGGGDGLCASVNIGENGKLKRIAEVSHDNSFAALYSRATFHLGMVPLEHEYKIMGMAPYGDEGRAMELVDKLYDMFEWASDDAIVWTRKSGRLATRMWGQELEKIFRFKRFDDISLAMQLFIEKIAIKWVKNCIAKTGIRRVVLSGGLFMNVKLNKLIMELPEVESIYIMPSCSDESNSIGVAYYHNEKTGIKNKPLKGLYLGAVYDNETIKSQIENFKFSNSVVIDKKDDIEDAVADLLAQGEIVARFSGREEFGARSLGNRSILSDPSKLENIVKINHMIKQRDFWMPFAGSMTDRQAEINLNNPKNHFAPYMIITMDPKVDSSKFRAATHPQDHTIRPQVVKEDWNPGYYKLIELFERKTGRSSGVLNTSFNLHGFPIVSSPNDAMTVFEKSGLRHLALGDYLLSKQ